MVTCGITCPACNCGKLAVDYAGDDVKCPKCETVVQFRVHGDTRKPVKHVTVTNTP